MQYALSLLAAALAVNATPFPQGITAAIAPSAASPSGCALSYPGTFGIAVMNVTAASGAAKATQAPDGQPVATQLSDGQPGVGTETMHAVSQIADGQVQATYNPVQQISDGQIQQHTTKAVSQISDGQIQQPKATPKVASQISDGQVQQPTGKAVSQISDGQIQQPTGKAVSQISDGQIQQPKATVASQISDGQPQSPKASQMPDGQPISPSSGSGMSMVACKSPGTLAMTLKNGILLDSQGRTGYIAANYQFQFDKPAQTGAIYTAGWSVCSNGSLALGGSTTFYQCLSGNFYNLYNENWAQQCNAVTINAVDLVSC